MRLLIALVFFLALPVFWGQGPQEADAMSGKLCEVRGICHKVAHTCTQQVNTDIINAGTTSYTIKPGVTQLSKVAAFAAGGGATNGEFGGYAGGGGAYSETDNLAVAPGNVLNLAIGTGGQGGAASTGGIAGAAGGDTSVTFSGSQILLAKGGQPGVQNGAGAGGQASGGVGTVTHSGGSGGAGGNGGGGGGGAAGPHGDGAAGSAGAPAGSVGPPYPGGDGGAGDGGAGGAGGVGSTQNNVDGSPGGNGSEFGQAGAGGGGGGGVGGASQQSNPGASGKYGGGGGGPGFGGGTFLAGASGADGVVAVQYTLCGNTPPPPPPQNTFFVATNGNDTNAGTLSAPFLTFGRCQTAMRNSPTVKTCTIRAGNYAFSSSITFTSADNGETWQYFTADGVDSADIDGGSTIDLFIVSGVSNLTINGLKMTNPLGAAVHGTGGQNVTIENNEAAFNHGSVADGFGDGFPCMICIDGVPGTQILHNYVHDTIHGGIGVSAFFAGGSTDGSVIEGNVVLRTCQQITDCNSINTNMKNTGPNGGHVAILNNYVRDEGQPGVGGIGGIYIDDYSSNVTVEGNIVAPPPPNWIGNSSRQDGQCFEIHNGSNNTYKNNICDLGSTGLISVAFYFEDGNTFGVGMTGNVMTNNIIISNYAGADIAPAGSCPQGVAYCIGGTGQSAAFYNIANNAYHNYGGGAEATNGPVASDSSPQHLTPAQLGLTCTNGIYSIAPGSAVLGVPVSFPPLPTSWGPPGFTIPPSSNHSC